jgi:peptidoglycan/xylan/chitin deacetylase (PgdA/CDA1 family)
MIIITADTYSKEMINFLNTNGKKDLQVLSVVVPCFVIVIFITNSFAAVPSANGIGNSFGKNNTNSNKILVLSFDDNRKGDFTYGKPILDKYGFKATFFIICGKTTDKGAMNWQDIAAMQRDGMDIESHTMTHAHLDTLSQSQLNTEIGGSKQCLASHGYNATIFAYPYDEGSDNKTVVNLVAKYYDIGRSGSEPLMFLDCKGFKHHPQTDCRTYTSDGSLTYANRYAFRSLSFDVKEIKDLFNNSTIFSDFIKEVNSQEIYNQNGKINAVPVVTFHNVAQTTNKPYYTNAGLFDQLMKYLHDKGFRVLTLKQIGYDTQTNSFYLKNSPETNSAVTTNTTNASDTLSINNKTPSTTVTTNATTTHHHVKGVKVLHFHNIPSKVAVGDAFNLQGVVFNNSTATISFDNGTCTPSPLSITFNGNVVTEPKAVAAAPCKPQQITLKPGEQSGIQSPNLSGMAYRATAPGMTNATMTFKYGVETATSKLPIGDSISRVYTFNIQPGNQQPTTTSALTNQLQQHQIQQPLQIQTTRSGMNATSAKTSVPVSSNASSYSGAEKNNTVRALSVSTQVGKNTIHPGDKQTITLKVTDTNTTNAIAGAKVTGSIMNPSGSSKKNLDGVTDTSGEASYSWLVGHNDATGRYKVDVQVAASGYGNDTASKSFKVTSIPVSSSSSNNDNSNNPVQPNSGNSDTNNNNNNDNDNHNHPSTIISLPHIRIPEVRIPIHLPFQ